jgi:trehalose synthase
VVIEDRRTLADYAAVPHLALAAHELQAEAARVLPRLAGRTVWMVSSTSRGGGVAEMLPPIVALLRDFGVRTEWLVIGTDEPAFFVLTKQLHNLVHGVGEPRLDDAARALFERVNRAGADALRARVRPGDVLVVHDPQPLPMAAMLREAAPLAAVWRCHIGLDVENDATRAAWDFLAPYLDAYDHAVFSAPEYIPRRLAGRATVIPPGIDPLAPKNMELSLRHTVEVLCNGGLVAPPGPMLHPPFRATARRLLADGTFAPASMMEDIGLLTRPIVTQISRWDRLKGWLPLMRAFAALKASVFDGAGEAGAHHRRRLDLVRLVLAGPEPEAIQDDPEGLEVLDELRAAYAELHPAVQDDIALVALPMASLEQNALLVNALQRASTLVVQNSLREGFGLTITEAMWKRVPVLSNSRACGPRQQVRDGLDGRLIADPEDVDGLRHALDAMLADSEARHRYGGAAQRRVHDLFIVIAQLRRWAQLFGALPPLPAAVVAAEARAADGMPPAGVGGEPAG